MTKGDVEAGLAGAALTVDATYETPAQYHNAMEPHVVVAAFDGDKLFVDTPTQGLVFGRMRIAQIFGLSPEDVTVRSPFLGGGFGGKGLLSGPIVLGIMAARHAGRPVKLVATRQQLYGPFGHRPPTRQRLRLGVDGDGRLTALSHHAKIATSSFDDFYESSADASHTLYASPAIRTSHEAVRLDTGTPLFMRAPGEASGSIALESAIDEMAAARGMDPLEFRLLNYAETEPISGQAILFKGFARMFRGGREGVRLGRASGAAAPDARQGGTAGRLGRRRRHLPGGDVPGRGARHPQGGRLRRGRDHRARHGTGRVDGAGADRRRRAGAVAGQVRVSLRHIPVIPTAASPAAPATPRRRERRSTTPAATPSPSSPTSPPAIPPRRSTAPATPASSLATAACCVATTKRAASPTKPSWRAPASPRSSARARAPPTRRRSSNMRCTPTARCSRR